MSRLFLLMSVMTLWVSTQAAFAQVQNPGGEINVYRLFNGRDHMLSLDPTEAQGLGYHSEGVVFRSFPQPDIDSVELFRCSAPGGGHFASLDPSCEGQNQEGSLGFLDNRQSRAAHREVVRCNNGSDHLITMNRNECYRNRYRIEAILGYVH